MDVPVLDIICVEKITQIKSRKQKDSLLLLLLTSLFIFMSRAINCTFLTPRRLGLDQCLERKLPNY